MPREATAAEPALNLPPDGEATSAAVGSLHVEAGREWEAAARLGALPHEMIAEGSDVAYVEGVINGALTLPSWVRRHRKGMFALVSAGNITPMPII